MASLNIPGWAMTTVTAALAFGAGVWSASKMFAEVENTANGAAKTATAAHYDVVGLTPRVTALEIRSAADGEKFAALMRQLDALAVRQAETAQDVKTLLSRTPQK
jgi:hypothetical protein